MPGVQLDEPYSIGQFSSAIPSFTSAKQFVANVSSVDSFTEEGLPEGSNSNILVTLQGEGIKLYNVRWKTNKQIGKYSIVYIYV